MIRRTGINEPLSLLGFIEATQYPAFVIPIFGNESKDGMFMQAVNDRGEVVDFSRLPRSTADEFISVDKFTVSNAIENSVAVGSGDEALFCFRIDDENIWTGTRSALTERLMDSVTDLTINPLLRLEILEFCSAPTSEIRKAIADAARYLTKQGVTQSAKWANVQLAYTRRSSSDHETEQTGFRQTIEYARPEPALPSVYLATAYEFRGLIKSNLITPRQDNTFGDYIVWTFYGRPLYRPNPSIRTEASMLPVAIILRPTVAKACVRVFPFDTGAFELGYHDPWRHPDMKLTDFECAPDAAGRIVSVFFGTNQDYLRGEPQVEYREGRSAFNFEAEAYKSLISRRHVRVGNDAPPIAMEHHEPIPLNQETTEGIILPEVFMEEDAVRSFLRKHSIEAIAYNTSGPLSIEHNRASIEQHLTNFYRAKGYL